MVWVKTGEGINPKTKTKIDMFNSMVTATGKKGSEGVEKGKGINGSGHRLDFGWGTHNMCYKVGHMKPVWFY